MCKKFFFFFYTQSSILFHVKEVCFNNEPM